MLTNLDYLKRRRLKDLSHLAYITMVALNKCHPLNGSAAANVKGLAGSQKPTRTQKNDTSYTVQSPRTITQKEGVTALAQKSSIEQTLETLVDLVDLQRKHADRDFSKLTASLDALTLNVGQLATQQKATNQSIDRLTANIDRMADRLDSSINRLITAVERQNNAIDGHLRLSESQSVNIAELTRLATKLIDKAA